MHLLLQRSTRQQCQQPLGGRTEIAVAIEDYSGDRTNPIYDFDLAVARVRAVRAVNRPVNVVTGWLDPHITLAQLGEAGAKRISVGGAPSRLALATFVKAAQAMRLEGSFTWMRDMIGTSELRQMLAA